MSISQIFKSVEPYFHWIGIAFLVLSGYFALHYKRILIPAIIGLAFLLLSRYLATRTVAVPKT